MKIAHEIVTPGGCYRISEIRHAKFPTGNLQRSFTGQKITRALVVPTRDDNFEILSVECVDTVEGHIKHHALQNRIYGIPAMTCINETHLISLAVFTIFHDEDRMDFTAPLNMVKEDPKTLLQDWILQTENTKTTKH